ncbi:nucleotidyltransferase domain-containing protein [Streptomyces sp. NPDC007088]|uniref:nucleotidyltransferase domain-containing protein n=1 Tax=Streptomyces sp. NPDC007088 TaxID=3364773 RepID=UPI0036C7020F
MSAESVIVLLDRLEAAGCAVWVAGGWGVDALLGTPTRPHEDLDLAHRADQAAQLAAALGALGHVLAEDARPVRWVLRDGRGHQVDLHPLVFAADGSARQESYTPGRPYAYPADCFVTGSIGGRTVPCLSARQQAAFHTGYPPRERDLLDMRSLRTAFPEFPDPYREQP